ncbi:MAG: glucose-1-phosphate cytidylyltransferase [Patescibacteria group bacterium]|nr:glucose-1-phosphate cytidylyltransferase [Patescibacteria group bacterium]
MTDALRPRKAVILAGGFGTRLTEETVLKPKPMVEIGEHPILWHIMKIYSHYGINDFVICLGYKGGYIKDYFVSYLWQQSSITIDLQKADIVYHNARPENWRVSLVDTGADVPTGERLRRTANFLEPDRPFCLTYGDGVADIDIGASIDFHMKHGKLATIAAVTPPGRFGALRIGAGDIVADFEEKPVGDGGMINGGFMVMSPKVFNYLDPAAPAMLEQGPLERMARDNQLMAYRHKGFWQPMDTLRDLQKLQKLWTDGEAPWKVWG